MTRQRDRLLLLPFMIGIAFAPLAFSSAPASAQTAEARFSVRATVGSSCVISTDSAVAGGEYRASVTCTNNARWTVSEHSGLRDPLRPSRRFLMSAAAPVGAEAGIRVITITY